MSSYKRGEVWLVDLGYVAKVRPCLIISTPALDRDRALATLIPHTTSPRGSRFEVQIKAKFLRAGVFDVQNIVTIPHAKLLRKLGNLTLEQMMEVEQILLSGWDLKRTILRKTKYKLCAGYNAIKSLHQNVQPKQVIARDRILEQVWGYDFMGDSNIIEVYIRYLRLKLEATGEQRLIQTVRTCW